ncbi:glycosyl hydrolase 53 family protein [Nonomuraea sp. B12E4]|uniref:glycoside hydrolase family 53 protein n=1 Tax=Nonomuraea sp. B12E4 TaxID=3153564 RepID=UPI00325F2E9E
MKRILTALLLLVTALVVAHPARAAAQQAGGPARLQIRGADISSLAKSEALGGVYRDSGGRAGDALRIMSQAGLNYIRLKVWVNPADGYNTKTQVLAIARRAKALGLRLLVDFHYSDTWADPAALLGAGYDAVKRVSSATKVVLHLANGGDNGLYRWWFDNAAAQGIRYDVIGLSYYPFWHGTLEAFQANLNDVAARYGKPVAVVETAYPFTAADDDNWANIIASAEPYPGYRATPQGQSALLARVADIVRAVPNGRGLGLFTWEATWTGVRGNGWDPADPSSGNGWENQALFDYGDRALPAMSVLGRG